MGSGEMPAPVTCSYSPANVALASVHSLQRQGAKQVIHVVQGGVPRWKREGWPIDEPTRSH
jgi:hypothetical protein